LDHLRLRGGNSKDNTRGSLVRLLLLLVFDVMKFFARQLLLQHLFLLQRLYVTYVRSAFWAALPEQRI